MEKITKDNFEYSKVKEILKSTPSIKMVKDDEHMIIIQTLDVSPFRCLFYSSRENGHKEDGAQWCFCIPESNKKWGWFAEQSYKDYTKKGKCQQYIAFDFTREYSLHNGCIVAFTVEQNKITWAHILNDKLTAYVKDCDERLKVNAEFNIQ